MIYGICGYGNLGKSVEKAILDGGGKLAGIFTRRKNVKSQFSTPVYPLEDAVHFKKKIDVMLMCGGSQEDLLWQSPLMLENFNIIDTFDTHARIAEHRENLKKVAEHSKKVAIFSCGWDPGLFSLMRSLGFAIFQNQPHTFWGKGVSQGHSEALRNIDGVADAVQFTVPNKEMIKNLRSLNSIDENLKHERHCFVVLDGSRTLEEVEKDIKNTENYFKGQKVFVTKVTQSRLDLLKQKTSHQGFVFGFDGHSEMNFSVKMDKNTDFTAKIILAYSKALEKLKSGVYSPLEIPIFMLLDENYTKIL